MTEHLERYKFIIILFFLPIVLFSQNYPDEELDVALKRGLNLILLQNYNKAGEHFSRLQSDFPKLPFGVLYSAAVSITKSADYASPYEEERVDSLLEMAEELSDSLLEKDMDNIWYIYLKGLSQGYRSYYFALRNDFLGALTNGFSALSYFKKCLDLDPDFYEAYTAIGNYHYWKSDKTDFINWLPLIPDNKEEGIEMMERALAHTSYNKLLIANSLAWIYINEKEYSKAIKISKRILAQYPDLRFMMWPLAQSYEKTDKKKAIEVYYTLLDSYKRIENISRYNEVKIEEKIARLYNELGEYEKGLAICDKVLGTKDFTEYELEQLEERIDKIRDTKEAINEKYQLEEN